MSVYEGLVLIDPDSSITARQLADELRRFYAGTSDAPVAIDEEDDVVTLRWAGYVLEVGRSCAPHVREESQELADEFASGHPDHARIAQCACRFEMSGDDDPDMDRFDDSLFVGEALERLGRVYRFDPATSEFL